MATILIERYFVIVIEIQSLCHFHLTHSPKTQKLMHAANFIYKVFTSLFNEYNLLLRLLVNSN